MNITLSSDDPDDQASDSEESSEDETNDEGSQKVMTSLIRTPPNKRKPTSKPVTKPIPNPAPVKKSKKDVFVKTVKAIYDFFQGTYTIETILQAIHGCAGDYRTATKKLISGFRGCNILEIPTTAQGNITPAELRSYLRGND